MTNWTEHDTGKEITDVKDMPEGAIGFVYLIRVESGLYIGRKSIVSVRKKSFGKKAAAAVTDRRRKLYEHVTKESDWKRYTGSNKSLNEIIKLGGTVRRMILEYAFSNKHLTYLETKHLFKWNVLDPENPDFFYNDNILGKFFRNDLHFYMKDDELQNDNL